MQKQLKGLAIDGCVKLINEDSNNQHKYVHDAGT